jgi:uncharacterized protein YkwD
MGTAIAKSPASEQNFTNRRDKVGVALTVLSSARLRRMNALRASLVLMLCLVVARAAATKRPGQPEIRISSLERRVHDLINKERLDHKLTALVFDERLSTIARGHSHDMAARDFFSHTNPEGQDATARGKLAGFTCRKQITRNTFSEGLGENLFQDNLYSRFRIRGNERSYDWNTPEEIGAHSLKGWMNSPPHRRNILEPTYGQTGVGIAVSEDDKVYLTQLFC